jgi:hypothetical protein
MYAEVIALFHLHVHIVKVLHCHAQMQTADLQQIAIVTAELVALVQAQHLSEENTARQE